MIDFDPAKDAANRLKHGLGLSDAENFGWHDAVYLEDARKDYGEKRYRAIGRLTNGRVVSLAFTYRGGRIRMISLRPAHRKERAAWHARPNAGS